jgi:hypothetical protein
MRMTRRLLCHLSFATFFAIPLVADLAKAATIGGQVRRAEDGSAVVGFNLSIIKPNGAIETVFTNGLGQYTWPIPADGYGKYVIVPKPDYSLEPPHADALLLDPVARTVYYIGTESFTQEDFVGITCIDKYDSRTGTRVLRIGVLAAGPPVGIGTATKPVYCLEDNVAPLYIYVDGNGASVYPINLNVSSPSGEVVSLDGNTDHKRNYRFVPGSNFFGYTAINFTLNDSQPKPGLLPETLFKETGDVTTVGDPEIGSIRVFVLPLNDLPSAANVSYTVTSRDTDTVAGTEITLVGTDIDSPLDPASQIRGSGKFSASFRVLALPLNGVLVNPTTGAVIAKGTAADKGFDLPASPLPTAATQPGYYYLGARFEYRPDPGFVGTDSFTYVVYDGEAPESTESLLPTSSSATVTLTVVAKTDSNKAPEILSGPSAEPSSPTIGQEVTFRIVAKDPEGGAITILWTFPDATTATGETVVKTFDSLGAKAVRVSVVDDTGQKTTSSITVNVNPASNLPPVISASGIVITPNTPKPNETLTFTVAATDPDSDPSSLTATWDFGDGTSVVGFTVTHVYTTSGAFTVSVAVSDGALTDTASVGLWVTPNGGSVGGDSNVNPARLITVTSVKAKLNLARSSNDAFQIFGFVPELPPGGLSVSVDVNFGNVQFRVFLNERGRGKSGGGAVQMQSDGTFKISLRPGDLRTPFDALALLRDANNEPLDLNTTVTNAQLKPIPILLVIADAVYSGQVETLYKARRNKNGQIRR